MKIGVQLATRETGPQVLEFLQFPAPPVISDDAKCSGYWYGKGKSWRFRGKRRGELIAMLVKQEFNEVDFSIREGNIEVQTNLTLSPLNRLWSSCRGYRSETRSDEQGRMSFESSEMQQRLTKCEKPSLLDCWFEPNNVNSLSDCIELLGKLVGAVTGCEILVGCADFPDTRVRDMVGALAPWPGAFKYLGERFDALHPILIGPVETCLRLQGALRGQALYKEIRSEGRVLGIVGLPDSVLSRTHGDRTPAPSQVKYGVPENLKEDVEVLKCLVPRDETTAHNDRVPDPTKGEATLAPDSTQWLYMPSRYRELMKAELLSDSEGFTYIPVLSRRLIPLLGLDPEKVFGWRVQTPIAEQTEALIDQTFDELSASMPLKERILRAHEIGYKKWYPPGFGHEQLMKFIKSHYFHQA